MPTLNLLYKHDYRINDRIDIVIPTVGEIIDREEEYYGLVSAFTAMPIDMMVLLDDAGIDFTTITDYDLFMMLFPQIKGSDTSLLFHDVDLSKCRAAMNPANETIVIIDENNQVIIDRAIHDKIAMFLRKIHFLEKNLRKPGNKEAQDYMLKQARKKAKRRKTRVEESQLERLIIAMVNTEQYKYGYEETRDLTIYQFNESVRQIIHKVDYDNRMHGIYAGTIDPKSISQDNLNWLTHK